MGGWWKEGLERGLDRGRERREGLGFGEREGGIVGLSDWEKGREEGREEEGTQDWKDTKIQIGS